MRPRLPNLRAHPASNTPSIWRSAGDYTVELVTGPTLEVIPGRKLSVAVGIDEQPMVTGTVFTPEDAKAQDFLGSKHGINTATNSRKMRLVVHADTPGRHTLKIAMIDPTMVIQTIAISNEPPVPSYFGPPSPNHI